MDHPSIPPATPAVRTAVEALSAFGGGLNQREARKLLAMWFGYRNLSEDERAAVVAHFPRVCGDAR